MASRALKDDERTGILFEELRTNFELGKKVRERLISKIGDISGARFYEDVGKLEEQRLAIREFRRFRIKDMDVIKAYIKRV